MNISGKLNLAAFKKAVVTTFSKEYQGIEAGKKVLIIPIDENKLFLSEKGAVYFDIIAFESDKIKEFTHSVKQSFSKADREAMGNEQTPFFGNLKAGSSSTTSASEPVAAVVVDDGLHF